MATIFTACGTPITIDEDDMEQLAETNWYLFQPTKNGTTHSYAIASIKKKTTYMHRLLTSAPKNMVVDHINNDGLDNRRSNLRVCSQSENMRNRGLQRNNTTGTAGISRQSNGKYQASIWMSGKRVHLGIYKTFEEAKVARVNAVAIHYGDFVHKSEQ